MSIAKRRTLAQLLSLVLFSAAVDGKLADRSRVVKARHESGRYDRFHDNGRPIEGPSYRSTRFDAERDVENRMQGSNRQAKKKAESKPAPWKMDLPKEERPKADVQMFRATEDSNQDNASEAETPEQFGRKLSQQLTGCCYNYKGYSAANLCYMYGNDCQSGETPSHDDNDDSCQQDGLSFIGISFSVNTASGNPYSYQLCDQFPMENIIDRNYDYVMSMDEDGWLVGGGYKTFDYSGKMP